MFNNLPKATQALLWINGGLFLLQMIIGPASFAPFALYPIGDHALQFNGMDGSSFGLSFMPWQLVTYAFLHDSVQYGHIFFNMLALLMFGAPLEYTWGTKRFLQFYFVCVIGAGLTYLGWAALMHIADPVIGASGGIFGLLLAYGMLFPTQRVMLLFPPIPMNARTLVIGYGVLELLLGVASADRSHVAHFAHLGGMLFGWLMIRYWRGQPPFPRKPGIRR